MAEAGWVASRGPKLPFSGKGRTVLHFISISNREGILSEIDDLDR